MKKLNQWYLKPYYLRIACGCAIKFTGTIMDLFLPWTLAHVIDTVIPEQRVDEIAKWGVFMLICSVLALLFNIIPNRMASRVASDVIYEVRRDLFAKVMYLTNRSAQELSGPSLISRLTSDTYNVHQMLARIQRLGIRAPILFFGGVFMTMLLDPVLAGIMLATLPLLTLTIVLVSRKSIPMFAALQDSVDGFVRLIREDIAGIRVIKALSKENYERERFDRSNREVVERERKATITTALTNPVMNILLNLGLVLVILAGASRVNRSLTEVGRILAFMTYFTIILNALLSISKMFIILSKAAASAERMVRVFEAESEDQLVIQLENSAKADELVIQTADSAKAAGLAIQLENSAKADELVIQTADSAKAAGLVTQTADSAKAAGLVIQVADSAKMENDTSIFHVEFRNVAFSYDKVKHNLEGINFGLSRGETLGIVGATGSGKSTVIHLLMRFYDVDEGMVLIDGTDVRAMKLAKLRRRFGTVFQNDTIFGDTIRNNITMGRSLTEEQALAASGYAGAREFIREKGGLHAQVELRGANLSGGQKQRLLIARALAAHPEILVLDDSFSALDYKTDAALRREIREHYGDTTCVIVAQRISSVMGADHIMVLEEGRVIGYGTHEELQESCEAYREISESQMGG